MTKELYSVATGQVNILMKRSRQAAEFMTKQKGFVAIHIVPDGRMLWLYETENAAKAARNKAQSKGIECGKNICRFQWDQETNILHFDDEEKMKEYNNGR